MPDNMSAERYARIQKYGGGLDLTPGTESDVILTLERTHQEYMRNPNYKVLAQFELLPNYRFHRYVTGDACLQVAHDIGNGRIAAFVSAPGSAGTLAAGDAIKQAYPDCTVVALEPRECPTLFNAGQGQHRIEGIGDKMVTLIHNILTTDFIMLIHDDDCVKGVKVIQDGLSLYKLEERLGIKAEDAVQLHDTFGISGVCNVIGAIKTAKLLGLNADDNVITIATDGYDRYPSVMADLIRRVGMPDEDAYEMWCKSVFLGATTQEVLDVRQAAQKERLFQQKEAMWTRFGYSKDYLEQMRHADFWENEVARIPGIDAAIRDVRGKLP
jgi:cysteine synthase